MTETELRIKNFSDDWQGQGYEKGETQKFWLAFLKKVLDVEEPDKLIQFEKPVKIDKHTKFIDAYIAKTKVLIEQKSLGGDLSNAFKQALFYADNLPPSEKPRWIVTCNFAEFIIHDLAEMNSLECRLGMKTYEPMTFKLYELRRIHSGLKFFIDPDAKPLPEVKTAYDAAVIVKYIYEAFERNYTWAHVQGYKALLDKLCTRLVFCFYASHAQIIDANKFFGSIKNLDALRKIFDTLNTAKDARPADLDDALKNFPYVNGGLFAEDILLPAKFKATDGDPVQSISAANSPERLNWRTIDPPVFGAMFESVLNDETRRAGGMHYTSTENIRKVIAPLFLDDLEAEFIAATRCKKTDNRIQALQALQDRLASLTFLDPACGSGNFLTATYLALRQIENKILSRLRALKVSLPANPVKVSINQFYGIEIHDFAVAVAQVAMYIAENQMLQQMNDELALNVNAFPLKNYARVVRANALRVDWLNVFGKDAPAHFDYIIGNPPFVGYSNQSDDQKADMRRIFADNRKAGKLDYVAAWYKKAADFIQGSDIRCAFVSTNSIVQGEQCADLWKNLFAAGVHIDFAYRTFKWLSESENMAHVHCVIVGFSSAPNKKPKLIFDGDKVTTAKNINAYLVDGENIFVESRNAPLQDGVPEIGIGNKPIDDGNFLFTPDEMKDFIELEPASAKYFKPWFGADEFIKGKRRYCLWLGDLPLDEIKKMPHCWARVEAVKASRLASKSKGTRAIAATPTRFHVENFPRENYLVLAKTSSGRRNYIPMGFMDDSVLCSDKVILLPNATLYHFGVLTSSIHMAWTRMTNCTLGTGYSYSIAVVYNNFPWPSPSPSQRARIERSAQEILDVRAGFEGWTFATLYNPETMPDELRDAHKANDMAVALAYGFEGILNDEAAVVAELMKLYERLASAASG